MFVSFEYKVDVAVTNRLDDDIWETYKCDNVERFAVTQHFVIVQPLYNDVPQRLFSVDRVDLSTIHILRR